MYWIGVDLDGTLAFEDEWRGIEHIGVPIPRMVERVKQLIADGEDVRIFTARSSRLQTDEERAIAIRCVEDWCETHLGRRLPVTNEKDRFLKYFWLYSATGLMQTRASIRVRSSEFPRRRALWTNWKNPT